MHKQLLAEARRVRHLFFLVALFSVLTGLTMIAQALLLSQIINRVFLRGESQMTSVLVLTGVVIAARALFTSLNGIAAASIAIRVKHELRGRLLAHLTRLGPTCTSSEQTGELVITATEGLDALDSYFRDYLPGMIAALLIPLGILVVVFPQDALTFIVLLVTAPLIPFFMMLIGKAAGAVAKQQYGQLSRLGAHFLDVMQGLTTLKLFNRSKYQIMTIGRITDEFRKTTMGVLRVAFLSAFMLEMLATLSVAIIAVEIGIRLLDGGIGFQQALFLLVIAPEFYQPLRTLGAKFHAGTSATAAASRIFELLATPLPPASEAGVPVPPTLNIEFKNVSFAYGERTALQAMSFDIRHGEKVALIGKSGSGKSTVASLLLRFITPDTGQILVDGLDLTRIDLEAWRNKIAWIPQSPYLFNMSVLENIRLSRPDATSEEIITAAKHAEAHEFIRNLPQGYDTVCGERGLRLSGGQAQRIAIARAFLRDAPLVIVDEMTAHLDPGTEAAVTSAFKRLLVGRTALVIAHRLHTIIDAHQVITLSEGKMTEGRAR